MDVGPSNCDNMGQSGGGPLIDKIVAELKSQGLFDQLRKECMADVDTKPAYQNLRQRVENTVSDFLHVKKWKPDLAKNKLRDSVRQHMINMQMLDNGIERIINQAISPKVYSSFVPQVEDVVCSVLGIEKPNKEVKRLSNGIHSNSEFVGNNKSLAAGDLLPTDLDPISPEKFDDSEGSRDLVIAKQDNSDYENEPEADFSYDYNDSSSVHKQDDDSADSTMDSFFAVKCKEPEADPKTDIMETRPVSHASSISNDDLIIEESTQMNSPDSVENSTEKSGEEENKKQIEEKKVEELSPDIKQEEITEDKPDENKIIVESRSRKSSECSKGKDSKSQEKSSHRSSSKHDTTKHSSKSSSDKSSRSHSTSSRDRSHTSSRDDKKKDDRKSSLSSKRDDSRSSKSDKTKDDKRSRSKADDHKSDSSKKHDSKKYSKDSHGEKQRQSDKDRSSSSHKSGDRRSEKSSKSGGEEKTKDNESSTSSSASPGQDSVNQKSQDKSESKHKNKDQDSNKSEKNGRDSKKSDNKSKSKSRDSEVTNKESNETIDFENNEVDMFENAEVIDFNDYNENSKLLEYEENKFKRPKIAENFNEIRKIMKLRKTLNRLDKQKKKRLQSEDVKLEEEKTNKNEKEDEAGKTNEEHESEDRAAKRSDIVDSKHQPEISEKISEPVSGPSFQESQDVYFFEETSVDKTLQEVLRKEEEEASYSSDSDGDSLVSLELNEGDYSALVIQNPDFVTDNSPTETTNTNKQQAEDKVETTVLPKSPYQGLSKENKDATDFVKDETPVLKSEVTRKRQQSFVSNKLKAKPQVPEKRFMLTPSKEPKSMNHTDSDEKKQVFSNEETNSRDSVSDDQIIANGHEDDRCKSPSEVPPSFPVKPLQLLQQGQDETDSEKQTLSRGRPKRVQTPRGVSTKQQRYDSSDLYKPRLSFASSRRLREPTAATASSRNSRNVVHSPDPK